MFFCQQLFMVFYGKLPLDQQIGQTTRVRSFPHVDGNYALHVYIPSKLIMMFKITCLSKHTIICFHVMVLLLQ